MALKTYVMSSSRQPFFQFDHLLYAIKLIIQSNQLLLSPTKIIPTHQHAFKIEGVADWASFAVLPLLGRCEGHGVVRLRSVPVISWHMTA
jgi:hypothetical protein